MTTSAVHDSHSLRKGERSRWTRRTLSLSVLGPAWRKMGGTGALRGTRQRGSMWVPVTVVAEAVKLSRRAHYSAPSCANRVDVRAGNGRKIIAAVVAPATKGAKKAPLRPSLVSPKVVPSSRGVSRPSGRKGAYSHSSGTIDNRSYKQALVGNASVKETAAKPAGEFVAAKKVARKAATSLPQKLKTGNKFSPLVGFARAECSRGFNTTTPVKRTYPEEVVQTGVKYVSTRAGHQRGCYNAASYLVEFDRACCNQVVEQPIFEKRTVERMVVDVEGETPRAEMLKSIPPRATSTTLVPVGVESLNWGNAPEMAPATAKRPPWFGQRGTTLKRDKMTRRELSRLLSALRLARTTVNRSCSLGEAFVWAWTTLGFSGAAPIPSLKGWEIDRPSPDDTAAPLHTYV
ncbi:hypothetical protein [Blackcurrant reversion virus satellite RNA]|uniref:hypothetical protein n=1 Tax=Blackcurrant reversion virus satellite RNA TaxID=99930 RepID=UPI00000F2CB9|nr:hypothetical protein [Blackcurrant reversion virus satellite RNA]AAF21939.1 unknown [Blackcurrant reversion virus satellite RNA]